MRVHCVHRLRRIACALAGLGLVAAFISAGSFTCLAQGSASQAEPAVRLSTQLVSLAVTITDKQGRAITGLAPQAFTVYEDGVQQQVNFFQQGDTPVSVVVVFDASGSMTESRMELARAALAEFIAASHPEDEYSLLTFNQKPHLLVDRVRGDGAAVLRRVAGLRPSGYTALHDAVAAGIEQAARSRYPRRTLLVLSDGEDNHSRLPLEQLRRRLRETDATLYAIGAASTSAAKPLHGQARSGLALEQMSEATGGRAFFPRHGEELLEVFTQIALELRQQYTLGYTPTHFVADGKWRRIKVQLTVAGGGPKLAVRHRPGYYAVTADDRRAVPDVEE